MMCQKYLDNTAGLLAKLEQIAVPPTLNESQFRAWNAFGQQMCVGGGVQLILAAMDDQGGSFDGGQAFPGVVPFAGLEVEYPRVLRDGRSLKKGLNIFQVGRDPGW